ncbi:hypothetical protein [Catellatospora sp. NPDC049609]|uniref:hypothetical protein n=1 Tax=Catellatospora sp. NPDC049609 TaxID=3155505 RepID=UPI0034272A6F
MTTHHDVHELIQRSWNTPDGPARIVLAEQALAQAEALGDPDLLYSANCAATSAYHQSGEPMKAMMTFARCLADYDADPGRRSHDDERLLLWQFKHVVSAMARFPELPLDRTMAVLDDMQRRYQAGGHSLQAVYAYRHDVAAHVGDTVLADHWYRMWDAAPRDRHSDCAGCDPSSKAYHLAWRGRDDEAIAVAEPALSGRLTCSEQPHGILTALLLPYLRTGRLDEARDAHRRAYRALCDNKAELGRVARHVEFCGLTGNEVRGLELIERHLPWLDDAPTPKTEMEFAAAAALVLRRLAEAGQGDLPVRRSGGPVGVAELGPVLRERAEAIARRFDARNGNTFQSGRVAEVIDAAPLVAYLPLSLTSAYTPAAVVPAPAGPQEADISAVSPNLPLDAQLDLAEQWFGEEDGPRGKALARRLLAATAGAELTDVQRGRLARLRANCCDDEDVEQVAQAHEEAVAAFARAGDRERELSTRVQWEISLLRLTGDESHLERVYELAEQTLAVSADPAVRRNTLLRAAWVAALAGDAERALDLAVHAEAEPGPVPPSRRARLLHLRAGSYHAQGRVDDAEAALREAIDVLRGTRHGDMLASLLMALARTVGDRHDPASNQAAIAAFEEAAAVAEDPDLRRSARANAGFMLVTTPRAGEFIDDIVEHVCLMEAEGSPQAACYTRHRLALALYTVDRDREAAEVAEEALAWFLAQRDAEHDGIVAELRDLLSRIYATIGEPHVALGQVDALLATVTGVERLAQRADLLERAGELLWQVDRDADAADRFDAAAQAYGQADLPLETVHARRRQVMALYHAGRHDEARAAAARLVELMDVTEVPAEQHNGLTWERATAGYEAALLLTNTDSPDHDTALVRIAPVAGWYRSIGAFQEALFAQLRHGQVLVVSGRAAQAEPLLRQALDELPAAQGARRDAAFWLARALDEQGERRKARKLRKEHDLPEPE